jgi:hypothetical protein
LRNDILQSPGRNFPSRSLLLFPEAKSAVAGGMGRSPNTQLAAKELTLKQPGSTRSVCIGIALAAALALALPGAAAAQDPSVDQYTPTAPSGGGDVPTSPVPNTEGGNGGPPATDSGGGGDSGAPATTEDPAASPVEPTAATATEETGGNGAAGRDKPKSKNDHALDSLAATAAVQREAAGSGDEGPATKLLRSESGGGLGMGPFLWAVLGVTALWAVAMMVRRRQDEGGHPA